LPVIAEQGVDPKAHVDRVVGLERVFYHEIVLVPLPLVCQVVGKDAEIAQPLRGAVGVACERVFDPAESSDRRIFQSQGSIQIERGWGRGRPSGGDLRFHLVTKRGLGAPNSPLGFGQRHVGRTGIRVVIGLRRRGGALVPAGCSSALAVFPGSRPQSAHAPNPTCPEREAFRRGIVSGTTTHRDPVGTIGSQRASWFVPACRNTEKEPNTQEHEPTVSSGPKKAPRHKSIPSQMIRRGHSMALARGKSFQCGFPANSANSADSSPFIGSTEEWPGTNPEWTVGRNSDGVSSDPSWAALATRADRRRTRHDRSDRS
jgi:hypothetical protein